MVVIQRPSKLLSSGFNLQLKFTFVSNGSLIYIAMRSENTSNLGSGKKSAKWLRPIVTFGLILDQDSLGNLEDMSKFSEEIGLESQHTMTLLFLPNKLKPQEAEGMTLLTPSGISWLGKFKSKEVKVFLSQSFDMLLCYQKHQIRC